MLGQDASMNVRGRLLSAVRDPGVVFAVAALIAAATPLTLADPAPLAQQPYPDSQEYADASLQLARGNGYVTYIHGDRSQPPRYPPGYSIALVPFTKWGPSFPRGTQDGAKFVVLVLLIAVWATAWLIGGPVAGGLAALLAVTGSFWTSMSHYILSDPLAATLTVLSLAAVAAMRGTRAGVVSGALAGAAVTVRLASVAVLASLLVALPGRRVRLAALAGAAPFVAALLVFQWATLGSPFKTGYDYYYPHLQEFSLHYAWDSERGRDGPNVVGDRLNGRLMRWTCPCPADGPQAVTTNIEFYPAVVLGLFWFYTPPFVSLLAFAELFKRRRTAVARYAAGIVVTNLVLFIFYFHQAGRFMAPVGSTLIIFSAAGAVRFLLTPLAGALRRRRAGFSH
jgi:hypothetical protein